MGLTGLTYSKFMINAGIPMGTIIWISTYFMACRTQKLTKGKENFNENETKASDFKATPIVNRATFAFILTMIIMLVYGIMAKAQLLCNSCYAYSSSSYWTFSWNELDRFYKKISRGIF